MKRKLLLGLTGAAVLGLASQLMAVNITIQDNKLGAGFGGDPFGQGLEDNETEPGTVQSQGWDLEAFSIVGHTLYMVGGWNFSTGDTGSSGLVKPGDLFIKIGGLAPSGNPVTQGHGTIANSEYGYNYAVILNNGLGTLATVQTLGDSSVLNTVVYDQFISNPWDYASGATSSSSTPISYAIGKTDAQMLAEYGLELYGGLHNVVSVDLSFLGTVAAGTDVWFSYTMECGNDSLKGQYSGGFRTPDGGTTLMLLGLGLSTLGVVSRKVRKV
jgi:hypothetical protein